MKTDSEIQKDVMAELKWEPYLTASEIGVAVKNGIVTLSGTVDSYSKKLSAEKAAKRISGVKAVAEDIEVKLPGNSKKTDADIAEAILYALKWNNAVDEEKIKVKVDNGWVTLEGETDWNYQKISAENAIKFLSGVTGITNDIKVKPHITPSDIQNKIKVAFNRSAFADANNIKVSIDGSKVTLSGSVRSFAERKDAEDAAWFVPGVHQVINQLEIKVPTYA